MPKSSVAHVFDFYASPSAAELAGAQGVEPVRQAGDIRPFHHPDPKDAEWFVRPLVKHPSGHQ